jgi:DNA topoisomerase I
LPDVVVMETWIRRLGTPTSGFRYIGPAGRPVRDRATLARIVALRVPPAWRDVHVAPNAVRSIQAWGFDARGRKQYRYNSRAVAKRELRKYHRVRQLAKLLPQIRRTLRAHSHGRTLTSETASAIALRLISESLFRPGSERYLRENRSYGITTLRKSHVTVNGQRAVFAFKGKSGKHHRQVITNPELLPLIRRLHRTPGQRLFRYRDAEAPWCDLSAPMLISYMRAKLGPFAVKDFRTWGATLRAATVLAELGLPKSASEARRNVALTMRIVSSELGNTPAICRASYVHPMVLARYLDDRETIPVHRHLRRPRTNTAFAHSPEERALIAFLDKHFPERRRRPRDEVARAA